ncbi:TolC family protein [Marinomonas sp. 15G1-11]|uniref:TolC family protein n=1 Tax=Marinomonas phaeophyticola TaxID=3004091 RepID=A0ABT4JU74_9GAMM|nr:TolC family protein [Marinomonas sp. 15G1-11]MCZ2721770.1 TolC family protein [Marinomonas sp. 15G1-11]
MRAFILFILLAVCLNSYAGQDLTLKQYLDLQLNQNYQIEQLNSQTRAQSLALAVGQDYWMPTVTAVAGIQEQKSLKLGSRTYADQFNVGIESHWISNIGTEITFNIDHINGEGLGLEPLVRRQESQQITTTISQPLLKNNSLGYHQMDKKLAENQWQQFINAKNQLLLSVIRDSMSYFVDYQVALENWKIQLSLLKSLRNTEYLVNKMYEVGKATFYELEQSRLQVLLQEGEVDNAYITMNAMHNAAYLEIQSDETFQLLPFSLTRLIFLIKEVMNFPLDLDVHPDYLASLLIYKASFIKYQKNINILKPDLDIFYQYQKKRYQSSLVDEDEVYGIRFSYLLTNKSLKQEQASLKATLDSDNFEKEMLFKKLKITYERYLKIGHNFQTKVNTLEKHVELASLGVEQHKKRYTVGKTSYFSLEESQKELIDKQIDCLNAKKIC